MIVALGAFLVPFICRLLNISAAVGEVLYGILIGPTFLDVVEATTFLTFLGQLGFIVLMFLAGLEIDFNYIKASGHRTNIIALFIVLANCGLAFGVALIWGKSLLFGLFLAAMSLGLPVTIMRETIGSHSSTGQSVILIGSVGEFMTIMLLTVFIVFFEVGFCWLLVMKLLKLVILFFLAVFFLKVLTLVVWWRPDFFQKIAESGDPQEIGMRLGMFIMLFFVGLAAVFEVKLVLGAFLAGAVLSFTFRETSVIESKMSNIGFGFLVPLFFIQVGVNFQLATGNVFTFLGLVPVLTGIVFLIKILPAIMLIFTGQTIKDAFLAGTLLACPLTLMIAIADVGLKMGIFDSETYSLLLVLSLIVAIISTFVIKRVHARRQL